MNPQLTGPAALFSSAWKLYRDHWKIIVPIVILPALGSYIGQLLALTHSVAPAVIGGLIGVAAAIFSIAMAPALINAIHRLSTEPGALITLKGQYRIGFGLFWPVILLGIINGLVVFGSFFFLVIPAIIVGVYCCFYAFALVIDGKRGFSALTESYSLVKGRWWPVLGRLLFFIVAYIFVWLILAGLAFVLGKAFGVHAPVAGTAISTGSFVIGMVVNLIGTSILIPLGLVYMYGLYMSLKATREASVETGFFKKWLIAFICVGVAGVVMSFVAAPLILLSLARSRASSAEADLQAKIQQFQGAMQQASSTKSSSNLPKPY